MIVLSLAQVVFAMLPFAAARVDLAVEATVAEEASVELQIQVVIKQFEFRYLILTPQLPCSTLSQLLEHYCQVQCI